MSFTSNALQLFHNRSVCSRYISQCVRLVPEIIFIRHTQNQTIGNSDGLVVKLAVFHIQSNLFMQSPVLRGHLFEQVICFLSVTKQSYELNLYYDVIFIKRSPKMTSYYKFDCRFIYTTRDQDYKRYIMQVTTYL